MRARRNSIEVLEDLLVAVRDATGVGLSGLVLSAVGLYGVLAYTVSLRTSEFAVRQAFGASARQLTGLVVGDNYNATGEPGEPQHWFGSLTNSVWFTWTPTRVGSPSVL